MPERSRSSSFQELGKAGGSSSADGSASAAQQSGKEDTSEAAEQATSKDGIQGSSQNSSDAVEVEDDMEEATASAAQNSASEQKTRPELSDNHGKEDTRPDPLATAEASNQHSSHEQNQHTSKAAQGALSQTPVATDVHQHHRLTDEVFLRAESITEREMKAITLAQYFAQFVASGLLVTEVVLKFAQSGRQYIDSKHTEYWNVIVAAGLLVALTACLSVFATRLFRLRHRHWSRRRRYITYLILVEACLQMLNLICWLAGNAYVLAHRCGWFDTTVKVLAFVKWTSWNSLFMIYLVESRNLTFWKHKGKVVKKHGKDRLVMDAPVWNHAWILINWVAFEGVTIGLLALSMTAYSDRFTSIPSDRCASFTYNCKQKPAALALLCVLFAAWFLWILLWMYYIYRALTDLGARPWQKYKMANTTVRVQMRMRLYSQIVFGLCVALLAFAKPNSCASYVQTWLGFSPMMVMETTMTLGMVYYFMPKTPELRKPMLQLWRQEFTWNEAGKQEKIELRNKRLSVLNDKAVLEEPMFCFETAVKAFYWTALIYTYEEEGAASGAREREPTHATVGGYTLEKAMDLWNLERFELLVEPAEDTKVLLGWNSDTIAITFRGTASLTNVLADLQLWRTPHPPKRGAWLLGQQPVVHSGFLSSWTANGLNLRVLDRVRDILRTPGADVENMRVLVTGHSLGGAQATLAAIDIAREFSNQLSKQQILVYPFGAPRTGNHAFAREYNLCCPDTWHIINDRDLVPRSGKLFRLYKRPGQRVLINNRGDMLVRPAFVEMTAQTLPFRGSLQHHMLASYQASFLAICSAQFGEKAFSDGVEGMGKLVSSGEVRDVLGKGYLDSAKAERIAAIGGRALWQLGAIGDQVTRAVGIPTAEVKAQAKAPKGRLRCHDGVCWREPEDGLSQEEGSIRWLRNKSKVDLNGPATPRSSSDSPRGLVESRSQKPLPGVRVSVSRAPPGSKMRSSSRALSVTTVESNAGEEEPEMQAKDAAAGPREHPSMEPGGLLQQSHSEAAGQGTAKPVRVSLPAAAVAGAGKGSTDAEFWAADVEDLERGKDTAWEEGAPEVFRDAYVQRFSGPPAAPEAHCRGGEPAEGGPADRSQEQQEEAEGSRGREAKVADAGGLSDRPGHGCGEASVSGTAAAPTAQDSRALKGREANGVQQVASGGTDEQGSQRHHGLHLPHFRLPHFHHDTSLKEKSSGASLGDPTTSWDIASRRSSSKAASTPSQPSSHRKSGLPSTHSESQEEEGSRHNQASGLGKDNEELKMSRKDNHYVRDDQAADLGASDSQGSQFYRPSKDETLRPSHWDNDHDAGRERGLQSAEAPVNAEAAAASRRHANAGHASSFRTGTNGSGESMASQDSWHSASLEEKIQLMASEGLLLEALQQSQERHLDSQQSWARRHLLSLPRRTQERGPTAPEKGHNGQLEEPTLG